MNYVYGFVFVYIFILTQLLSGPELTSRFPYQAVWEAVWHLSHLLQQLDADTTSLNQLYNYLAKELKVSLTKATSKSL